MLFAGLIQNWKEVLDLYLKLFEFPSFIQLSLLQNIDKFLLSWLHFIFVVPLNLATGQVRGNAEMTAKYHDREGMAIYRFPLTRTTVFQWFLFEVFQKNSRWKGPGAAAGSQHTQLQFDLLVQGVALVSFKCIQGWGFSSLSM